MSLRKLRLKSRSRNMNSCYPFVTCHLFPEAIEQNIFEPMKKNVKVDKKRQNWSSSMLEMTRNTVFTFKQITKIASLALKLGFISLSLKAMTNSTEFFTQVPLSSPLGVEIINVVCRLVVPFVQLSNGTEPLISSNGSICLNHI